ncbi:MAG: DUF695 domain-containing protein [Mucilaginibacter sp.]
MNFLKSIFAKKDEPIKSYEDFWNWFTRNEKKFFKAVETGENIEADFFNALSLKLGEIKEGFYYLTGMYDNNIVELILTAEGNVNNIVFVEELVKTSPELKGWKFTALKPALDIADVNIDMDGYKFNKNNISFYPTVHTEYPDEIDITIVHDDFSDNNEATITNGVYIFLDNFLGELKFATTIDNLNVIGSSKIANELIPVEKLKDFLVWREKEFVEKYEGIKQNTDSSNFVSLKTQLNDGNVLLAIVNDDLLNWDKKASHPWILNFAIKYLDVNGSGMPDDTSYKLLEDLENEMIMQLKDCEGYLNIGRQTGAGMREIYFACKNFRKPSKVAHLIRQKYAGEFEITYDIYKDKYWQSFERFRIT